MRNGIKIFGITAVAALSLVSLAIQTATSLKRVVKVGDVARYRLKAEIDYQGSAVNFTGLITEKVSKVAEDGQYTVDSSTSEGKVMFAGNEKSSDGQGPSASSTVFKNTGEVVSITAEQSDPNLMRMANLMSLRLPGVPVKIGDKWESTITKNDFGAVDAKGTYQIEALEKVGDRDTYRIHVTLKESIEKDPAGADATYWIDVKDCSFVKLRGTWTNAPFPGLGAITIKISMTREG